MPASRSRTERWRDCLVRIAERGGALEIALAGPAGGEPVAGGGAGWSGGANGPAPAMSNLIWRVRVAGIQGEQILIEPPCALGQAVRLDEGVNLIAIMSIGQNRWMFHTRTLPPVRAPGAQFREPVLRIAMPETVERCMRRNFYRISTAELAPAHVECWPLLDPTTVIAAEVANRAQILEWEKQPDLGYAPDSRSEPLVMPEVGPMFHGRLANIGGGGAGLLIDKSDAGAVERPRLFWLRVDLTPHIVAPIGLTARLAHTHVDSSQNIYAGLAFEFGFNPGHREFVVDQMCRYVAQLQRRQFKDTRSVA